MSDIFVFPNERKHTLAFLNYAKNYSPVFLDTDVNMTRILNLRKESVTNFHRKFSIITYFIYTVSRILSKYPEANSTFSGGGLNPQINKSDIITAKFAMDKTIGLERVVLPGLVPHSNLLSLQGIQNIIDYYKLNEFHEIQEYASMRKLQQLHAFLSQIIFSIIMTNSKIRRKRLGTFSVSSLGHTSVNSFFSTGGTTLTFGLGQIKSQPVVQEQQIKISSVMRLSMTFDHRVIDGAMAADILNEVKESLEKFN